MNLRSLSLDTLDSTVPQSFLVLNILALDTLLLCTPALHPDKPSLLWEYDMNNNNNSNGIKDSLTIFQQQAFQHCIITTSTSRRAWQRDGVAQKILCCVGQAFHTQSNVFSVWSAWETYAYRLKGIIRTITCMKTFCSVTGLQISFDTSSQLTAFMALPNSFQRMWISETSATLIQIWQYNNNNYYYYSIRD